MVSELVTVVIPAFNAEKFLNDSITSALKQTYRPLEVLVVNDGSTDGTIELTRQLQQDAGDVKLDLIDIGSNKGAANALFEGFKAARGSYVCWLSADDAYSDIEKISTQYKQIKSNNADWSYYRSFKQGESLSQSIPSHPSYLPRLRVLDFLFTRDTKLQLACLMFRNPINGSSVMIKKEIMEAHGQFDPYLKNVDADGDLFMRYSALGLKCSAINGSPVFYRIHGLQTSKSRDAMSFGQQLSRIRIMHVLAKYGHLRTIFERFTALFPLAVWRKDHLFLPKSTEFLCKYLLDKSVRANPLLRRQARLVLDDVTAQMKHRVIDSANFELQLSNISSTPAIRSFEQQLAGD